MNYTAALLLICSTVGYAQDGQTVETVGADAIGYFTFINVLWVFVGLLFLVAVGGLFGKYVAPLIENAPAVLLEFLAYGFSGALVFGSPYYFGPIVSFIAAIVGLPLFAAAAAYRVAELGGDKFYGRVLLTVLIGFTAAAALAHNSQFIGGVSALFLMWLFGSWVFPLYEGFKSDTGQLVPSGFWGSAIVLVATAAVAIAFNPSWLYAFKPGIFWLAGLGCSGGLLVLSCRYYYGGSLSLSWIFWQLMAIGAGIAALFLGHTYHSLLGTTVLQEIGCTFLATYLIAKVTEIPWDLHYWPWLALFAALAAYTAVNFASKHPDYFLAF